MKSMICDQWLYAGGDRGKVRGYIRYYMPYLVESEVDDVINEALDSNPEILKRCPEKKEDSENKIYKEAEEG